jgi:hypothetical protein
VTKPEAFIALLLAHLARAFYGSLNFFIRRPRAILEPTS